MLVCFSQHYQTTVLKYAGHVPGPVGWPVTGPLGIVGALSETDHFSQGRQAPHLAGRQVDQEHQVMQVPLAVHLQAPAIRRRQGACYQALCGSARHL